MIYLCSDRLRAEVCEPGEAPNDTFRFDRAGFVSEITLDGHMRFCASEPNNLWHPSSGGRGLCSEILFDASNQFHIGEYFPKLGVGLLKKSSDEPYCFYRQYQAELFPVTWETTSTEAIFHTRAIPAGGIAVEQQKRVSVQGNNLLLAMRITNAGEQSLTLSEYCHNFLSIGGMAVQAAYCLDLPGVQGIRPGPLASSEGIDNYCGTDSGIQICGYSDRFATVQFGREQLRTDLPFVWKLENKAAGAGICCEESFQPERLAVWSADHMISPEVFYSFTLEPGETVSWQRTYRFISG